MHIFIKKYPVQTSRGAAGRKNFGRAGTGGKSVDFPGFFRDTQFPGGIPACNTRHTRPIFPKISGKNDGYVRVLDSGIGRVLMRVCSSIGLGYWSGIELEYWSSIGRVLVEYIGRVCLEKQLKKKCGICKQKWQKVIRSLLFSTTK